LGTFDLPIGFVIAEPDQCLADTIVFDLSSPFHHGTPEVHHGVGSFGGVVCYAMGSVDIMKGLVELLRPWAIYTLKEAPRGIAAMHGRRSDGSHFFL